MSKPPAFDDRERAELVAYLDGELEGDAARAVERKLALDPAARAEAETLRRTWDLLDYLPRPEPSPSFTHRTLEKLAPVRAQSRPGRRRWRVLLLGTGWAAALVLTALGGYAGYNRLVPREPGDAELVRDLNLIRYQRVYELVEDLDGIRELDQPDLFGADSPGS